MKITGLILLIVLMFFFLSVVPDSNKVEHSGRDSVATISIAVVGDLMCHSVQFNYAQISSDSFDFNPVYRYVQNEISSADFAFGNLETVTAGSKSGYSGYPFFNSPDEFISALRYAGFDLLTTSNNHSLDRGEAGLLRTIEQVSINGMGYNGTFKSKVDRDSIRIVDIKGVTVAFLAYSYGTNGLPVPKGKDYLINLIDTLLIRRDIESARLKNPDIILVHYHFGEEYKRNPSREQKDLVQKTIGYGADIIIGGHPHVIQPGEFIAASVSNVDSAFVIYSMGNFISNQRKRYTDSGLILRLNIQKNFTTNKINIETVNITPTWVFKGVNKKENREYVIIPEGIPPDSMDINLLKEDYNNMLQAFKDTKEMLFKDRRIH